MAGVNIRMVQELMGHSTVTMTMRYAHLPPAHLREPVAKASLRKPEAKTGNETVTATVTKPNQPGADIKEEITEPLICPQRH
jgi:hypothetical protein